jgi:hypothetical protein
MPIVAFPIDIPQGHGIYHPTASWLLLIWKPGQLYPSDSAYIGFESHQGEPTHQELSFEGVIDEVLVFSRALNIKEILTHADRK